jgi:hypothetical protein
MQYDRAVPDPNTKKHLPVLGSPSAEEKAEAAVWVWSLLGGLVVIATWVPLALAVSVIVGTLAGSVNDRPQTNASLLGAVLLIGGFSLSSWLGGALVGRFCARARRRDATLAGAWGWIFVLSLAALGNALRPAVIGILVATCLLLVALPLAALGGRWGERRRLPPSHS